MTLLLKNKVSAVESNAVLETLHKAYPHFFDEKSSPLSLVDVNYNNNKSMFIFGEPFKIDGITGTNIQYGKKK